MDTAVDPVVAIAAVIASCVALVLLAAWYLTEPDE
jgi:hypothetical protein